MAQSLEVADGTAGQCLQVIATFQGRHQPALATVLRRIYQQFGDPSVVIVLQQQAAQGIFPVSVKARRNKYQVGSVSAYRRQPVPLYRLSKTGAAGTGRQWCQNNVLRLYVVKTAGVERILEARTDHHFWSLPKYLHRTVAVMDVEIKNGNAFSSQGQRMFSGEGYVVEDTKAHGQTRLSVVPRWSDGAESVVCTPCHHRVYRLQYAACGQPGGPQAVAVDGGVSVDPRYALPRIQLVQHDQVFLRMDAFKLLPFDFPGLQRLQSPLPVDRRDRLLNVLQARRTLRVVFQHDVFFAIGVRDKKCGHSCYICPWA